MATTTDDLIGMKDEAVEACDAIAGMCDAAMKDAVSEGSIAPEALAAIGRRAQSIVESAAVYSAADEDPDVESIEGYEAKTVPCYYCGHPERHHGEDGHDFLRDPDHPDHPCAA